MNEFSKKTKNELENELIAKREALRKFRFEMAGSKIKNVKEGANLRKDVAKILTALNLKADQEK